MTIEKFSAIYVSTPDGDEFDLQDKVAGHLSSLLASRGVHTSCQVSLYIDNGYYTSGNKRPALEALSGDIQEGLITEVYMHGSSISPATNDVMCEFDAVVKESNVKIKFF